jgi:rubrerythrin
LIFPENTNFNTQAWRELSDKQTCPICGMGVTRNELSKGCPWCGWTRRRGEK